MAFWNKGIQNRINNEYEELRNYYDNEYSKEYDQLKNEYNKACLDYTSNASNANGVQLSSLKDEIVALKDLLQDFGNVEDINPVDDFVFNAAIRHYNDGKECLNIQKTKLPFIGGKKTAERADKDYSMEKLKLEQNLITLKRAVSCIKMTEEVSKQYVLQVTSLIGAIKEILPKIRLIKAYIYADTFYSKIKEGVRDFDNEQKPKIEDYKEKKPKYYDFIIQAKQYYDIALKHYKNPVLSDNVDPVKESKSIKEASRNI